MSGQEHKVWWDMYMSDSREILNHIFLPLKYNKALKKLKTKSVFLEDVCAQIYVIKYSNCFKKISELK